MKKGKTLSKSTRQVGKSVKKLDLKYKAKAPGKRISSSGKTYYEYRRNRTDVKGRDTPKIKPSKTLRNKLNRLQNFINNVVKEKSQREKLYNKYLPLPDNYSFEKAKKEILNKIESNKIKINRNSKELEIKRQVAWEEKQERKLERLKSRLSKAQFISKSSYDAVDRIGSMIPFGQPILVGHHSQRRHERDIERMDNLMRKSIEASDKAEYLAERIKSTESSRIISGDDPQAINKLKTKLKSLESQREQIKEHNKKARKDKNLEPYRSYVLTNLGQNIKSVKDRIERLERASNIEAVNLSKKGIELKVDKVDNRIRLFFEGIPEPAQRTSIKRSGFRWSPYNKAWQIPITPQGMRKARTIFKDWPNLESRYL